MSIPIDLGRDDGQREAIRELSKPIYHQHDPSLVQRALAWALGRIARLLEPVAAATTAFGLLGLVVILVVLAALVGLIIWRIGAPARARAMTRAVFGDEPIRSAAEYSAAAAAAAAAGRWNEAVQERFRAIVRGLEERDLIEAAAGRTADEAMAAAAAVLQPLAGPLWEAALTFDDVTYGDRSGDVDAYTRLTELDTAVRRARRGTPMLDNVPATFGMPQ